MQMIIEGIFGNLHLTSKVMETLPTPANEQMYSPSSLRPALSMVSVDTVRELSRVIIAQPLSTAGPVHVRERPSMSQVTTQNTHQQYSSSTVYT